jgi:hypothetical protein
MPETPAETCLVRVLDAKTLAPLQSAAGVEVTRVNDATFTFSAPIVADMMAHLGAGTFFEVSIQNPKTRKTDRWRTDAAKLDPESGVLTLTVKKVGA